MQLAGFTLRDVIHAHGETVVSTAVSEQGEAVVLKILDSEQPSPELLARWRHEFALLRDIDSEWVIKARALVPAGRSLVLVLENFGPQNLSQLIARNLLDLNERLQIALQLAQALSSVHAHQLIHGDLAPKNVLVDLQQMRLKLCDFGLATRLDQEEAGPQDGQAGALRGSLDYMAPEQTGRTNLVVDYRSDFYALGVSLYELFGGRKPFQAADAMALLHAHLALPARPLHELNPQVPEALAAIVHKLLAKSPDARYQSSFGLLHDLRHCADELRRQGSVAPFMLGRRDVPERFSVSQRLVGREAQTAAVLAAFERVGEGRAEAVLVSGESGIGKTALVAELHAPVLERRGYFLRGKCDQFNRNQPYLPLVQAFAPLMQQLSLEGPERLHFWRDALHRAMGDQAGAVAEIVPQLQLLMGSLPPLQALPAAENEQRLHIAFERFVRALAAPEHPLMVFLDDLQWADAPTLQLLVRLLSADDGACLLVVGAYRDNEVGPDHPLHDLIGALQQRPPLQLQLQPLTPAQVAEWLGDTLRRHPAEVEPLAALCFEKTAGNPFFLNQFLRNLHALGDLAYAREEGVWQWQLEAIRARDLTDNVVALMLGRLRGLPEPTRDLLARAAHLGGQFDLHELMLLAGEAAPITALRLWPALAAGLVLPLSEHYKFEQSPAALQGARYRFLHDRVQQAAYELTPAAERRARQLDCGRRLLQGLGEERLNELLFVVLECWNQALELVHDAQERARLCQLNLQAGLRAKAGAAYGAAARLLGLAASLLNADAWERDPVQAQQVYKALAESEFMSGRFEAAEALYPLVHARCADPLLRAEMCLVQVDQLNLQGRFLDALPVMKQGLALVGTPFSASDQEALAAFPDEFAQTQALLAARTQPDWLLDPEMQDPARKLEMRLSLALTYTSYQCGQFGLFLVQACRMVRNSLQHGLSDLSSVACVAYTTALSAMKRPYAEVYAMGRLAVRLAEARPDRHARITVYQYFAPFYQHWGEPLQATLPLLDLGIELGESGMNPLSTGYCVLLRAVNRFVLGSPLDELAAECERGLRFLQRSHQPNTSAMLRHGVLQPLRALRGETEHALSFDSADCSSSAHFAGDYRSPGIVLAFHSAAWLRHAVLFGAAEAWRLHAPNVAMVSAVLPDSPTAVDASYYHALGLLRPGFSETENLAQSLPQVEAELARLRLWAQDCAANFRSREQLLAAELARVRGQEREAMSLYAQAIDSALDAEQGVLAALANELYARFWLEQQQRQLAMHFLREAHYHYRLWGALQKCRQLQDEWPQLSHRVGGFREHSFSQSSSTDASGLLDLASLLKASQSLSQQIHLDALLQDMLRLLLENAGAENGAIVSLDEEQVLLEVRGGLGSGRSLQTERIGEPLQACGGDAEPLPLALLDFVRLTRSTLVVNEPARDPRFAHSPYLQRQQPCSALCLPVLAQGRLVALVYLEHRQLKDAFTLRQQRTLEMLGTQAAISLVNARLVENLEAKVAQRTEALRQMSMKDGLTGIANRRAFDERLLLEWRRCQRQDQPLSLLMLDIDHFKLFNDRLGHVEGDRCIQAVAQALSRALGRATDLVARYGGEEFAILLPHTDAAQAAQLAATCLERVAQLGIAHPLSSAAAVVSLSIGQATRLGASHTDPEALVRAADEALYRAKRAGRNRASA